MQMFELIGSNELIKISKWELKRVKVNWYGTQRPYALATEGFWNHREKTIAKISITATNFTVLTDPVTE